MENRVEKKIHDEHWYSWIYYELLLLSDSEGTRRKSTLVVRTINSFSISTEDRHTEEEGSSCVPRTSCPILYISIRKLHYRKPARSKSRRGEGEVGGEGERGRTTWEDDESSKREREWERERVREKGGWKSEKRIGEEEEREGSARSAKPALKKPIILISFM